MCISEVFASLAILGLISFDSGTLKYFAKGLQDFKAKTSKIRAYFFCDSALADLKINDTIPIIDNLSSKIYRKFFCSYRTSQYFSFYAEIKRITRISSNWLESESAKVLAAFSQNAKPC